MGAAAAVGVDDYLAAGKAGIAVGTSDYEFTRGVYVQFDVLSEEGADILGEFGQGTREQLGLHIVADYGEHLLVGLGLRFAVGGRDEIIVLGGDHDGVDAHGMVVVVVFYRHLALGVGAQVALALSFGSDISHGRLLAADFREFLQEMVAEAYGERDIDRGLVAGVAEHHSLVAGALFLGVGTLHAAVNVGALLVHGREYATRFAVEFQCRVVVADRVDYASGRVGKVDLRLRFHLAGNHHLAGGHECLARHLRVGVVGEHLVEHGVGNLVGHLVGMALRNGFGCKQIVHRKF